MREFEIAKALEAGADKTRALLAAGLIDGAALNLQGQMRAIALKGIGASVPGGICPQESAIHA